MASETSQGQGIYINQFLYQNHISPDVSLFCVAGFGEKALSRSVLLAWFNLDDGLDNWLHQRFDVG